MASAKLVKTIVNAIVSDQGQVQSGDLAAGANISRQAAHRHLRLLTRQGILERQGGGRGSRYRATRSPAAVRFFSPGAREAPDETERFAFALAGLAEDSAWTELLRKSTILAALSQEGRAVFQFAVTEVLNNAIEHAGGGRVEIKIQRVGPSVAVEITDEGVGVFRRLREALHFADDLHALEALARGKITTSPTGHTGDGLFIVSQLADLFELGSDQLVWVVDNVRQDVSVRPAAAPEASAGSVGTRVRFEARAHSPRSLAEVLAAHPGTGEAPRARIVVKLYASGPTFVSRAEARRLVVGLEKFHEIVMDFSGVLWVGQGFVDEVFRVWATKHPEIRLRVENAAPTVAFMIARGRPKPAEARLDA